MTRTHLLALAMLGTVGCRLYSSGSSSVDDDYNGGWSRQSSSGYPTPSPSSSSSSSGRPGTFTCEVNTIQRDRELLITDPEVLGDEACAVPWSFASVMAQLAGGEDSAALTLSWLTSFKAGTDFQSGGVVLKRTARPEVYERLACAWLKQDPSNECDDTCSTCTASHLDMSKAPFRAVAVVNRGDLSENDPTCSPAAGEGRVVFNAVDPVTKKPLPFTAIFEYRMGRATAADWHALGNTQSALARRQKLAEIVAEFQASGGLLRVRTNENVAATYDSVWEMREFAVVGGHKLAPAALANTPRDDLWNTAALGTHMKNNQSAILVGRNMIPANMATGYASMRSASFRWDAPGVHETVRQAFSEGTCNGCHGGERPYDTVPFRHIALDDEGRTVVSRFLSDPSHPDTDELSAREDAFKRAICKQCRPSAQSYYDSPNTGGSSGAGAAVPSGRVLRTH
jgi:hypothetical protein